MQNKNQRTIAKASFISNSMKAIAKYTIHFIQFGWFHSFNNKFIFQQNNTICYNILMLHHKSIDIFYLIQFHLMKISENLLW